MLKRRKQKITKNNDSALFSIILCCTEYLHFTFYYSELERLPLQQQCYDVLINGKLITNCFQNSDVHVVVIHVVVYLLVAPRIVVSIVASVYKHFLAEAKLRRYDNPPHALTHWGLNERRQEEV